MSQLERVEEERRSRKTTRQRTTGGKGASAYVSYNPTKEEKAVIKEMEEGLVDIADFITTYLQDGYVLTFKFMTEQECYSLVLRENLGDWKTDRALSCWHVDWLRTWQMMFHALHNRYANWPSGIEGARGPDVEW